MVSAFTLDCGCCGEVGGLLKGGYKLTAAVGIAAVVGCVDADEDVKDAQHFGTGECVT